MVGELGKMQELKKKVSEKIVEINAIREKLQSGKVTLSLQEKTELPHNYALLDSIEKWLVEVKDDITNYGTHKSFENIVRGILNNLHLYNVLGRVERTGSGALYVETKIPNNFGVLRSILTSIDSYRNVKKLGFGSSNTVLVGSNGSGKSTLATQLKQIIQKESGIVITAQRSLLVPNIQNLPAYGVAWKAYQEFDRAIPNVKRRFSVHGFDDAISIGTQFSLGSELLKIMALLLAEKIQKYLEFDRVRMQHDTSSIDEVDNLSTTLDKVFKIWNEIFFPLSLTISKEGYIAVLNKEIGTEYDGNSLSDGEKDALYLIGRVLLAPLDSLIVIDEPETHLHKSVVKLLWDRLEKTRRDCTFFYFTHDIEFATSRIGKKLWLKQFKPQRGLEIQELSETNIPESLYLKILGSKRKILFCEGESGGFDHLLYSKLFPEFFVEPVSNCRNVRSYVKAFNVNHITDFQAFGIIDKDLLTEAEINNLAKDNIFVLRVSEVENVFLLMELLEPFNKVRKEKVDLEALRKEVIEYAKGHKERMVSQARSYYASMIFSKPNFEKMSTVDEIKAAHERLTVNGIEMLKKRVKELEEALDYAIKNMDYDKVIEQFFDKGLIVPVKNIFNQNDKNIFREKLLDFLEEQPETASKIINKIGLSGLKASTTNETLTQ